MIPPKAVESPISAAPASRQSRGRRYARAWVRRQFAGWVRDTAKGAVIAVVVVLVAMVLYQLGLVAAGQELSFDLFSPLAFWHSFTGLVVEWSQFDERLLLLAAIVAFALTLVALAGWYRARRRGAASPPVGGPWLRRAERMTRSLRTVGVLAMFTGLFMGAWLYQQYLWSTLPVPSGSIGVAFMRQASSAASITDLTERLNEAGHGQLIVVRDLPVRIDPRDPDATDRARALAIRLRAQAVVILREEPVPAAASVSGPTRRYAATLVFTDPSVDVEIAVPDRAADGALTGVAYRTKEGVDVPRIATTDLVRVLEATAGIVLYDRDEFVPAVGHLRKALSPDGAPRDEMDPTVAYVLGNALRLLGRDAEAEAAVQRWVETFESRSGSLTASDRAKLVLGYADLARSATGRRDDRTAAALLDRAAGQRREFDASAMADPRIARDVHRAYAEVDLARLEIANQHRNAEDAHFWVGRMADEGRELLKLNTDRLAQNAGLRVMMLAGGCQEVSAAAYAMLAADPAAPGPRRLLVKLTNLRDVGEPTSPEAEVQLRALTSGTSPSVPDVQFEAIQAGLLAFTVDRGYLGHAKDLATEIVRLDPTDLDALALTIDDARVVLGWRLFTPATGGPADIVNIGHAPTFARLQAQLLQDSAYHVSLLDEAGRLRSEALRLALELDPTGVEPRLQLARLSGRFLGFVQTIAWPQVPDVPAPDPALVRRAADLIERSLSDLDVVLAPGSGALPRQLAEASYMRSNALRVKWISLVTADQAAALALVDSIVADAEAAQRLVVDGPDIRGDLTLEGNIQGGLRVAYAFAINKAQTDGDAAAEARFKDLMAGAERARADIQQRIDDARSAASSPPVPPGYCAPTADRTAARKALAAGDFGAATQASERYVVAFPNDPSGALLLGRARFAAGDLAGARAAVDRVLELDDRSVDGAALRVVLEVASGRASEALAGSSRFHELLDSLPPASRLARLATFGTDLARTAARSPALRDAVRQVLAQAEAYVDGMPAASISEEASVVVLAEDALGYAALSAGDAAGGERWFDRALALSPDFILARAHRAATRIAARDDEGATAELIRAINGAVEYQRLAKDTATSTAFIEIARVEFRHAAVDLDTLRAVYPDAEASLMAAAKAMEDSASALSAPSS